MEKLVEFLLASLGALQFWTVIDEYEQGVRLRLGKFKDVLGPGLHLIRPFYIDHVITDNVVPSTESLGPQTLTTADGKNVVVSANVTWHISDIKRLTLEVEDANSVMEDHVASTLGDMVVANDFEYLMSDEFWNRLTIKARRAVKTSGIHIEKVQFSDLAEIKSFRIIGGLPTDE